MGRVRCAQLKSAFIVVVQGVEAVAFVDVSTNESGTIVSGLDKATAVGRFHLRDADGTLVSGAQAFKGPALVEIMTDAELV